MSFSLFPCFYINLEGRPDRRAHVEGQLAGLGLQSFTRMKAVEVENGAVGCAMSHLKLLKQAQEQDLSYCMIVEDDILFLKPDLFLKQVDTFLASGTPWDVLLIAGNNLPPHEAVGDYAVRVSHCQTTTGYVVQRPYYNILIDNIKEGIQRLIKNPENRFHFAIDKWWLSLQKRDRWYLVTPLTVTQRADYSNIEKRATDYTGKMLDLDKTAWLQAT
jgi:glycosyl transferase family 25